MSQAANIAQLQDLPLPPAVSYMPQTWGWPALLGLLAAYALFLAGRALYRWHRDRYLRLARAELTTLEQRLAGADLNALRELPELLKRTALSMPQRPAVASLSGDAWQQFLQAHSHVELPADFSRQLAQLAYAPEPELRQLPREQINTLLTISRHWLEHLHVAV